jgi:metallo-beta-lactamase family protein
LKKVIILLILITYTLWSAILSILNFLVIPVLLLLAGSGMCTGGRIVEHLKAGIHDPKTDILFVGYQADGTPGRQILNQAGKKGGDVILDGESYPIGAKIYHLTGYSAHADQQEILQWAAAIKPRHIKLVHGESRVQKVLKTKLARTSKIS